MSLNVSFDGFIYDKDAAISVGDVYYQALFYPNGTASSSTAWNTTKLCEATGYYNINVGDSDWLGQEGSALTGAKVVIVFWKGSTDRLADCSLITEWSAIELVLSGASVYSTNVQVKDNIIPTLSWSNNLGSNPYADTSYSFTNNSADTHSWVFGGISMYHWYIKYDQTIFNLNKIVETSYTWGDGESDLGLVGAANKTHTWDSSGVYTIEIEVEDACGSLVTDTIETNIYWRPPVPNIVRCDSLGNILSNTIVTPDTPVYFKYSGTDNNSVIVNIAWTINDTGDYGTTNTTTDGDVSTIIEHIEGLGTTWKDHVATPGAFTNPGSHVVTANITWFDGFENQTLSYNETFVQSKFYGPSINIIQLPEKAEIDGVVSLTNNSTGTINVGDGLPDGAEYFWTWFDSDTSYTTGSVPFIYVLSEVALSAECSVMLCAEWSDGWDTKTTCKTQDIIFDTTVTVTQEDCYYLLDIVGTSDDGTVTSYGWTVSSGVTSSGIWEEVWSSPTALDQQNKKICFASTGWYKIEGIVYGYGAPTDDFAILYVSETCPGSDSPSILTIWDGTGELDTWSDWNRIGYGEETQGAMYEGTNGLVISEATSSNFITMHTNSFDNVDICDYDFLSFWINVRSWEKGSDLFVSFYSSDSTEISSLSLSYYVNFDFTLKWQRVMIPILRFEIPKDETKVGWPMYVNTLKFTLADGVAFWLDNIALTMGDLLSIPVCDTDASSYGVEDVSEADGMIAHIEEITPPSMTGQAVTYPRAYPYSITPTSISRDITTDRSVYKDVDKPFPSPKEIE